MGCCGDERPLGNKRKAQRAELNWHVVAIKAQLILWAAWMILQGCPTLRQGGQAFMLPSPQD